jgi:hypothetical protein
MAVTTTRIIVPARPSGISGLYIDKRRPVTMFYFVKLTGDVAFSLDTKLQWCKEVIVLDADGVTVIAATSTTGSGAPGTFTTALAALGAGLTGFIICVGNKTTH